ncbi:SH3 domain-containing protein [Chitinophaga sp. CB10]|uniref:SH3 domain-containing protein n=1 Tax=Chitinophaga sp. CB10 TaxID=1891659 RepID=UPI0025BD0DB9|nr:SH3 domain-containing protein [Chitinophaga sp. CB10]
MRFFMVIACLLWMLKGFTQVKVSGYYRKDGTYVQPHYRSSPDGNPYNNWSYPGNVNPYTGKVAPGNPDTYLKNYYNRSSNDVPATVPSYNPATTDYSTTTVPTYTSTATYFVSSTQLNVRSAPSTSGEVLGKLNMNDEVEVLGTVLYPWYRIRARYYDGNTLEYKTVQGYVHASYLTKFGDSYTSTSTGNTWNSSYDKTVTDYSSTMTDDLLKSATGTYSSKYFVKSAQLNVRSGPSVDDGIISTINYGEAVNVVATSSYPWYWIKLTYYEPAQGSFVTRYGYVHASGLSTDAQPSSSNGAVPHPIPQRSQTEAYGKVGIWTDCSTDGIISVYVDDIFAGELTSYFTSYPDCASKGVLTIIKPAGTYRITAKGSSRTWEGTTTVYRGECRLQLIAK